jgi:hypothetical protein
VINLPNKTELYKNLINTRLHKSNGGWIYCSSCSSTVGYLCYSTYSYFKFDYTCNCGENGSAEIGDKECLGETTLKDLSLRKGRLCCPDDDSPLFTIVNKNIMKCSYAVVCKSCSQTFRQ